MKNLPFITVFMSIEYRQSADRRFNSYLKSFLSITVFVFLGVVSANAQSINFTGDVETDFSGQGVFVIDDGGFPDVGVPAQVGSTTSGWDVAKVYFFTDIDRLYIGIDYYGIAGDADGDGFQGTASAGLISIGGMDFPDMASTESLAIFIDLNQDGTNDIVAGVPGGDPPGGMLGCTDFDLNDCFGVFNYLDDNSVDTFLRFLSPTGDTINLFALPSTGTPDIEFSIDDWDVITGWDNVEPDSCQTYEFDALIYSGSDSDAGIGEDFINMGPTTIPGALVGDTVSLEVCADCAGTIFGEQVLDACGVCGGNNSTCSDCAGIVNGDTQVDQCGVCGGDGSTCAAQTEPKPIPTLSEWGLISLAGILGVLGVIMVIRKKQLHS